MTSKLVLSSRKEVRQQGLTSVRDLDTEAMFTAVVLRLGAKAIDPPYSSMVLHMIREFCGPHELSYGAEMELLKLWWSWHDLNK